MRWGWVVAVKIVGAAFEDCPHVWKKLIVVWLLCNTLTHCSQYSRYIMHCFTNLSDDYNQMKPTYIYISQLVSNNKHSDTTWGIILYMVREWERQQKSIWVNSNKLNGLKKWSEICFLLLFTLCHMGSWCNRETLLALSLW